MNKKSLVHHPKKDDFLIIRNWVKLFCSPLKRNADCAAAIASKFEYWHNANNGKNEGLEMIISLEYLRQSLLNCWSKNTIIKCLDFLQKEKIISVSGGNGKRNEYIFYPKRMNDLIEQFTKNEDFTFFQRVHRCTATSSQVNTYQFMHEPHRTTGEPQPVHTCTATVPQVSYRNKDNSKEIDKEILKKISSRNESDSQKKEEIIILEIEENPEVEIKKKVTQKKSSAKRKVNNGWTAKWLDIWNRLYKIAKQTNDDYISEPKDFRDFGRIKNKLELLYKKRNDNQLPTDEILLEWFEHFATKAMKIKWLKENYRITNLASQFNQVISYQSDEKSNMSTIVQELAEKHRRREEFKQNHQ